MWTDDRRDSFWRWGCQGIVQNHWQPLKTKRQNRHAIKNWPACRSYWETGGNWGYHVVPTDRPFDERNVLAMFVIMHGTLAGSVERWTIWDTFFFENSDHWRKTGQIEKVWAHMYPRKLHISEKLYVNRQCLPTTYSTVPRKLSLENERRASLLHINDIGDRAVGDAIICVGNAEEQYWELRQKYGHTKC